MCVCTSVCVCQPEYVRCIQPFSHRPGLLIASLREPLAACAGVAGFFQVHSAEQTRVLALTWQLSLQGEPQAREPLSKKPSCEAGHEGSGLLSQHLEGSLGDRHQPGLHCELQDSQGRIARET